MSATFGLGPPPPLPAGSGHLDILYRGFATEQYCTFGRGEHGTRKGHELTSGIAYFIQTPKGIKQVGPDCAKRVGKQKLHTVPDYTREAISPHKGEKGIQSGRIIEPPALFNEKKFEEEQRAQDIAYLRLRAEILPGLRARERKWRHKPPLIHEKAEIPLIMLLQEYKKDPSIGLGEVRRIREYAEQSDERNSETRLLRCYLAHEQIERCLKSRKTNCAETYTLHEWDRQLAETRSLSSEDVKALNEITKRVAPNMPSSKENGLPEIIVQAALFDGVSHEPVNPKLHIMLPREKPKPPAVQRNLFG